MHITKICALKNIFAEHDAIKHEVGMLQQLAEKSSLPRWNDVQGWEHHERNREDNNGFCGGSGVDFSTRTVITSDLNLE
jgi:hypothetical protein